MSQHRTELNHASRPRNHPRSGLTDKTVAPLWQTVSQGVAVQARVEAVLSVAQHATEVTVRDQRSGATIGTETFGRRLLRLELPHQRSDHRLAGPHGEHHATSGTAHRPGYAEGGQVLDNLVEVIARQAAELTGEHLDIQMVPRRLTGEEHQDAEGDVGGCKQAKLIPIKLILTIPHYRVQVSGIVNTSFGDRQQPRRVPRAQRPPASGPGGCHHGCDIGYRHRIRRPHAGGHRCHATGRHQRFPKPQARFLLWGAGCP
jgi:hypothetical protein